MYSDRLATLFDRKDYPVDAFDIRKRLHGRELIAYGAGECCHWFVEIVMKIHGYRPSVFLDRRFSAGDLFEGIPAMSPDAFQPGEDQKANAVAVICSGNEKYVGEIRERLRTMGIRDILLLRDVYEVHNPFSLPSELAREGFGYYSRHEREIRDALELLQDDESREVYVRCLQTHMERRPTLLPQRPRKEQYFPRDIALGKGYDRFVCCGSYDGDTVRLLNEVIGKVRDIVCFEPEGHLFARLADNISSQSRTLAERIVCLPCAVYDEDRTLRFASGSGLGSRIAEWGNALVQSRPCTSGFRAHIHLHGCGRRRAERPAGQPASIEREPPGSRSLRVSRAEPTLGDSFVPPWPEARIPSLPPQLHGLHPGNGAVCHSLKRRAPQNSGPALMPWNRG